MWVTLMRSKISSLYENFEELTKEIDKNNYRLIDYMRLSNKSEYDTENFIEEYQKTHDDLSAIVSEMDNLFNDNNFGNQGKLNCHFVGHCETCVEHIDDFDYCYTNCIDCKYYRKMRAKDKEEFLKNYYNEHISDKSKQLQEYKSQPNKSQAKKLQPNVTNINNNLIINNIIIKNYIQTKDLFFHVVITTNEQNSLDKLRYMFTYLMCGSSGIKLFPEETKFSKATTYAVTAAKYNIIQNNDYTPRNTLHGVLRYKYNNSSSMNIKKLEKMGNDKFFVKVYVPDKCNNKAHVLKDDIDVIVNNVVNSNNGSPIEDFYIEDLNN